MKQAVAEFVGTMSLVLFGCGAAVIAGGDIGLTGISFAFGLALIGMAYGIGNVSGCHINPAVTIGAVIAGRLPSSKALTYILAQLGGAVAGAAILFVVVILGATGSGAPGAVAGIAIGLTLVVIHLVGINVTGVSVNPARSFGPALFAGGHAISQLWLFILAPVLGAAAAGALFKSGVLDSE